MVSRISEPLIKPIENSELSFKGVAEMVHEAEVGVKVHARPRWRCEAEAEVQLLIKVGV